MAYSLANHLKVSLSARNLLDQEYFNSADRKVPLAAARSFSVALSWERGERHPF